MVTPDPEVPQPAIRIAPLKLPERYSLPTRPPVTAGPPADAHRQTQFLLGSDLMLFEQAMNLQLNVLSTIVPGKYRTHAVMGLVSLWSRAYRYLTDACELTLRASYVSTLPLLRAACDCIAAQQQLAKGEMPSYLRWLSSGIGQDREHAAFEFALGHYHAGDTLVSHERLGAVYRVVSELRLAHFGATAIEVAHESNPTRLVVLFADDSFHLAWTELALGWLLTLADVQLEVAFDSPEHFPAGDELRDAYERLTKQIIDRVSDRRRCRVEEVTGAGGDRRYLFQNFRRLASGAPTRIIL